MMLAYVDGRPMPRRSSSFTRLASENLGGGSVKVLADQLAITNIYPSGTSGSPWADAWSGDSALTILKFISIVVAILALGILMERISPGSLLLATGSLVILGRTHAPYLITTIYVPALILLSLRAVRAVLREQSPGHIDNPRRLNATGRIE